MQIHTCDEDRKEEEDDVPFDDEEEDDDDDGDNYGGIDLDFYGPRRGANYEYDYDQYCDDAYEVNASE